MVITSLLIPIAYLATERRTNFALMRSFSKSNMWDWIGHWLWEFHPFFCSDLISSWGLWIFEITIPPRVTPIGFTFTTDEDYLSPILVGIDPEDSVYIQIPLCHHFCKTWVTWIHNERPLTSNGAREILVNLQTNQQRTINMEFWMMDNPAGLFVL